MMVRLTRTLLLTLLLVFAMVVPTSPANASPATNLASSVTYAMGTGALASSTQGARLGYRDGLYLDLGLGYAGSLGERGVPLRGSCGGSSNFLWDQNGSSVCLPGGTDRGAASYDEVVRTEGGDMLGLQLILGYNILGHVSVEGAIGGAGNPSDIGGSVHAGLQLRYHPVEPAIPLALRDWDVNVMAGVGYSLMGYTPQHDSATHSPLVNPIDDAFESKGWEGIHISFGAGFQYRVSQAVSIGLDLKVIRPLYNRWVANFEAPYKTPPESTPEAWVVMPTAQVKFHLWSPERAESTPH